MLFAILKKVLIIFTTNIEKANYAIFNEAIRYYESKDKLSDKRKVYYEKNEDFLLAKSKLNQQNRKAHTQQIKDLNDKVNELTQAMETLI